jgi:hypothetical protein
MRNSLVFVLAGVALATLSGCIVAPARGYGYGDGGGGYYQAPPGVVYVAPTYASPGPGWGWEYHAQFGWGWHHPRYGWHRGWR